MRQEGDLAKCMPEHPAWGRKQSDGYRSRLAKIGHSELAFLISVMWRAGQRLWLRQRFARPGSERRPLGI